MDERRAAIRERVIYGATAGMTSGRTQPCVVRNISDAGAMVVLNNVARLPEDIALSIARKGRAYQARIVWWRDNNAGVAFDADAPDTPHNHDLEERLRLSEKKARQLKRRLRELLGEG